MAIKKGYKQTEIGIIPEDWEVKCVKEIFVFLSTATYSRSQLGNTGKIQCLHYGDIHIKYNNFVDFNKIELPKILNQRNTKYALLQDGDIVMADASEDYVGLCKSIEIKNIKETKAISGLHTILLREKGKEFANGFKGFLFDIFFVRKQLVDLATGMKVFGVSKKNLESILLPIPTFPEQTAIATVLSDTDALITALDKLIVKKKLIKQGAMQQLLTGKKRLSGFSGKWVEKKLGEIGEIGRGRVISHNEISKSTGNKYPVYSSQTQDNGIMGYIDTYDFEGEYLTWTTDGVYAGKVFYRTGKFNCTNVCGIIKLKNDYTPFVAYLLDTITPQYVSKNLANPKLMNDVMKSILIPLPEYDVQVYIATILSDMDAEIAALETKRDKYKQIKSGMMQELLTGKIRLIKNVQQEQTVELKPKKINHNDQINEAVVISFLVYKFGTKTYPLSRYRYTKYAYLLHRQVEHEAKGFLKHAAGPYKSENRYKGGEGIALKNQYISKVPNPQSGKDAFVVNEHIEKALSYFYEWYGTNIQQWIEQFRYYKNDDLEVLTTVDESICDLEKQNKLINIDSIKEYIRSIPQWRAKLDKACFNDFNIQEAINKSYQLFGE
ncbi:MAG: restriction endonuclease subunit S [Dysgonamonadaceae bacterium]|jgi:type I restriction enzyme S subunit|nr:restriction endonuclease subunit S [Dysgonamonadaceae bacterium]